MSSSPGSPAKPAQAPTADTSLPFHLRGNYAPVLTEVTAFDLPVRAPSRAGPARPATCATVRTRRRASRRTGSSATGCSTASRCATAGPPGTATAGSAPAPVRGGRAAVSGPTASATARWAWPTPTSSLHAGRILALVETSFPTEVTRDLETLRLLRLRRAPHHRHDGAPEDLPPDRRAALLRLLVHAALPHVPPRRRRRPPRPERGHRGAGADDDPRLRDHRPARRVHGPPRRLRPRAGAWRAPCRTGGATSTVRASA